MWTRENGTWEKYKFEQTQRRFKENNLEDIKIIQKCTNSTVFTHSDNLEDNIYNVFDNYNKDNWKEYHNSIKGYYNIDNVLENLTNINKVDLVSTENIDLNLEYLNLLIDDDVTLDNHLVLLKDQINLKENGIYKLINNKFKLINTFENYSNRINFSVYSKLGNINKNKQFFLKRKTDSLYPSDIEDKEFKEGHNYVIKNKFEYKNLNDIILHDGAIKRNTSIKIIGYNAKYLGNNQIMIENVPIGTLPNANEYNVYLKIKDANLIFDSTIDSPLLIKGVNISPNGSNFDYIYDVEFTTNDLSSTVVELYYESDISITVGEFGMLIRNSFDFNDGKKVEIIETGDKNRLKGIHMTSDGNDNFTDIVYVCGNNGTILKSEDGGINYNKIKSNTKNNLNDICFQNINVGITAGEKGLILITEDGGKNWIELQPENVLDRKDINAVRMNSIDQGIAIGERGSFYFINKNNGKWNINKIPLIRKENSTTSYPILDNLNDIYHDVLNNNFYIAGDNKTLLKIDENFNTFFFNDNNLELDFNFITKMGNNFILGGKSEDIFNLNPIINLNPNSNVTDLSFSTISINSAYKDVHEYNKILISPSSNDIDGSKGLGNHNFYSYINKNLLEWINIENNIFTDIKSKLLILDYKLGRKLYFSNEKGELLNPIKYYNEDLNIEIDCIELGNSILNNDTISINSKFETNNFFDYYSKYNLSRDGVYHNKTITLLDDITKYRYKNDILYDNPSNVIFNIYEDYTELNLSSFIANPGDLLKIIITEKFGSNEIFLETTSMVLEFTNNIFKINEILNETIINDIKTLHYINGIPYTKYEIQVININYSEIGANSELVDLDYCLNESYFNFYDFKIDKNINNSLYIINNEKPITTYFNMSLELIHNNIKYSLEYDDIKINFKYGPYYNLLDILKNINSSVFNNNKTFDMVNHSPFIYNNNSLQSSEFIIINNKILFGELYKNEWEEYLENTFVDLKLNGTDIIKRILIIKKEKVTINNVSKYYIHFDCNLQNIQNVSFNDGDLIKIRSRNKLSEISVDLTRGDDIHYDILFNNIENIPNKQYTENISTFDTDNYCKILSKDIDIKNYITGIIYTDNNKKISFNILNINKDPNFNFEPIELYDIGIDNISKMGNNITPYNINTTISTNNKTSKSIFGIDFTKFSFKLVDDLNISILNQKYKWILEAEIENAVIGENENGLVWYEGEWECGTWNDGLWKDGIWYNGDWLNGIWNDGVWNNGVWNNGVWNNGLLYNILWNNGVWNNGIWNNGQWNDGVWNNGIWRGGSWNNGIWNNGKFSNDSNDSIWYFGYWNGGDFENGLWKDGYFNQKNNIKSRFGTKSTFQSKSIWENGFFINGEIHSYLKLKNNDELSPLISDNYEYTIFKGGELRSASCYGATFKQGNWKGGNMLQGYIDGKITIDNITLNNNVLSLHINNFEDVFLKEGNIINIIGNISENSQYLPNPIKNSHNKIGYNTNPVEHKIYKVDRNNKTIDILIDGIDINELNGINGKYDNVEIVFTVYGGIWENSIFNNGLWLGGQWNGGLWMDGIWNDGIWMDIENTQP